MMGRSHFRIGILTYAIAATAPAYMTQSIVGQQNLSIVGMLAAGIAALVVDADCDDSKINRANPITGTAIRATELLEKTIRKIIWLLFTFGGGGILLYYSKQILLVIKKVQLLDIGKHGPAIVYGTAVLLIILGILGYKGERILRKIPLIGHAYSAVIVIIRKCTAFIKRILMLLIYMGVGAWVMAYNYNHLQDPMLYVIGIFLICTAVFPHRTFLHSPEGLIMFSAAAVYVVKSLGLESLAFPIIIGYASHLYLGDIFTAEGVPLSSLPIIFEKTGLHGIFKKFRIYNIIFKLLDRRIAIPLMSTGTKWGAIFEAAYVFALLFISVKLILLSSGNIQLI